MTIVKSQATPPMSIPLVGEGDVGGANSPAERNRLIIVLMTGFGALGLIGALLFHAVPEASAQLVGGLAGMLTTAFLSTVSYYFHAAASGEKKDETIAKQLAS